MSVIHDPLHPGIIVKDELIDATGINITEAAKRLGVSRTALSRLLNCHADIRPEMALRLPELFNTSIKMWINLQAQYDTWLISKKSKKIKIRPFYSVNNRRD